MWVIDICDFFFFPADISCPESLHLNSDHICTLKGIVFSNHSQQSALHLYLYSSCTSLDHLSFARLLFTCTKKSDIFQNLYYLPFIQSAFSRLLLQILRFLLKDILTFSLRNFLWILYFHRFFYWPRPQNSFLFMKASSSGYVMSSSEFFLLPRLAHWDPEFLKNCLFLPFWYRTTKLIFLVLHQAPKSLYITPVAQRLTLCTFFQHL